MGAVISSIAVQDFLIYQGATVTVGAEFRQDGVYQPRRLVDAGDTPVLTLYNPSGVVVVDDVQMELRSVGRYTYLHHTGVEDPLGLYSVRVTAFGGLDTAKLDRVGAFVLQRAALATYDVFVIRDSSGVAWYWYVDAAGQAVSLRDVPPTIRGRVPVLMNPAMPQGVEDNPAQPYDAIQIRNTDDDTRYVFPDILGQFIVDVVPPAGSTSIHAGSPTFTSPNGRDYLFSCDILNQLLVLPA